MYGQNLDTIYAFAQKLKKELEGIDGVKDLYVEPITGGFGADRGADGLRRVFSLQPLEQQGRADGIDRARRCGTGGCDPP